MGGRAREIAGAAVVICQLSEAFGHRITEGRACPSFLLVFFRLSNYAPIAV